MIFIDIFPRVPKLTPYSIPYNSQTVYVEIYMQQTLPVSGTSVTYNDLVRDRTGEIEQIEEDTNEIFAIMANLDKIVYDQDDDIMHIEETIIGSCNNTKKATKKLEKTKKKRKKNKWGKCVAITIGITLIILGVIVLLL